MLQTTMLRFPSKFSTYWVEVEALSRYILNSGSMQDVYLIMDLTDINVISERPIERLMSTSHAMSFHLVHTNSSCS